MTVGNRLGSQSSDQQSQPTVYILAKYTDYDLLTNYLDQFEEFFKVYPELLRFVGLYLYKLKHEPAYSAKGSGILVALRTDNLSVAEFLRTQVLQLYNLTILLEPTFPIDAELVKEVASKSINQSILARLLQILAADTIFYHYTFSRSVYMNRYHKYLFSGFMQLAFNCFQAILAEHDSPDWKTDKDRLALLELLVSFIIFRFVVQYKFDLAIMNATDFVVWLSRQFKSNPLKVSRTDLNLQLRSLLKRNYTAREIIEIFHDNGWLETVKSTSDLISLISQKCSPLIAYILFQRSRAITPTEAEVVLVYRFVRLLQISEDSPRLVKVLRDLSRIGDLQAMFDELIRRMPKLIRW